MRSSWILSAGCFYLRMWLISQNPYIWLFMKYVWRLWVLLSSCDYGFCSGRQPASWLFWACVGLVLSSVGGTNVENPPSLHSEFHLSWWYLWLTAKYIKRRTSCGPCESILTLPAFQGCGWSTCLPPGHGWMRTLTIFSLLDHRRRIISVVVGGLSSHRAGLLSDREVIWTPGLLEAHVRKSGIHGALTNPHNTRRGWLGSLI